MVFLDRFRLQASFYSEMKKVENHWSSVTIICPDGSQVESIAW